MMTAGAERSVARSHEFATRAAAAAPLVRTAARLDLLPFAATRAVIINCGTKWVTSLALVSALARIDDPVLIIDCESKDGSREHFASLARRYRLAFEWLEWPLRRHPAALDALFREIRADQVLLIDSDVEVRGSRVFGAMREALAADPAAYGAGFVHGPRWMGRDHGLPERTGYYAERMWIPFVLLRTAVIREALAGGLSFDTRREFLEIHGAPGLARLIGQRFRVRGMRRIRLPDGLGLHAAKHANSEERRPAFVQYDTGADLHQALGARGRRLAALPPELWGDVHHFHGVSRTSLAGRLLRTLGRLRVAPTETQTPADAIMPQVLDRLQNTYGIDVAAFTSYD